MFQYKLIDGGVVRSDDAFILNDERNSDWVAYLRWLKNGGVPLPAVATIPSIPEQVSRYQARTALYKAGLLDGIEAIMDDPKTDRLLVIAWQDAQNFKRDSPMMLGLSAKLGLSELQIDQLFIAAAAID